MQKCCPAPKEWCWLLLGRSMSVKDVGVVELAFVVIGGGDDQAD